MSDPEKSTIIKFENPSEDWLSAHQKLLQNVTNNPFIENLDLSVSVSSRNKRTHLPAYIPYIGLDYFDCKPKVLCYAINQNLSKHVPWTSEWLKNWFENYDTALDRLNSAAKKNEAIPIRPYAEGFIPLVAFIAIYCLAKGDSKLLPKFIDDVIAVTNFVKFSTSQDASSSSIPKSWWSECGKKYVLEEIRILRPDIIIGFGHKTTLELKHIIMSISDLNCVPLILGCRFPSRISSLKGRKLLSNEEKVWTDIISPFVNRIRKPVNNIYHKWKIFDYPGYFIDVYNSWWEIEFNC